MTTQFPNRHFSPFILSGEFKDILSQNEKNSNEFESILIVSEYLSPKITPLLADFMKKCKNLYFIMIKGEGHLINYYTTYKLFSLIQDLPITKIEFIGCVIDEVSSEKIAKVLPKTLKNLKMVGLEWSKKFFQTILDKNIQLIDLSVGKFYVMDPYFTKEKDLMEFLKSFNSLKSFEITETKIFNFECLENHQIEKLKLILENEAMEKGLANLISKQATLKVLDITGFIRTLELMKVIGNSSIEDLINPRIKYSLGDAYITSLLLYLKNVKNLTISMAEDPSYTQLIFKILAEKNSLETLKILDLAYDFSQYKYFFIMLEKNSSLNYIESDRLFMKFTEMEFQRISQYSKKKFYISSYFSDNSNYIDALINNPDFHNVSMAKAEISIFGTEGKSFTEYNRNIELWKIKNMNFQSHSEDIGFKFH